MKKKNVIGRMDRANRQEKSKFRRYQILPRLLCLLLAVLFWLLITNFGNKETTGGASQNSQNNQQTAGEIE